MKEQQTSSVLNVLMYLFHNHMGEDCHIEGEELPEITLQLEDVGFDRISIQQAFDWLDNLNQSRSSLDEMYETEQRGIRVFNDYECEVFDLECRSYLLMLQQLKILSPKLRELVIDLIIPLEHEGVDVSLIKWVTLMVLYNDSARQDALANMELLVLNDTVGGIN
ncbi:MAG: DUF494 domain-containing protein [Coxiellaceae bacterium]|nr:DUF494 domain-containing protein [Coxiellaceae bacterium]